MGASDPDDAIMLSLPIWKAGYDDHPELIYGFNPTPQITKEPLEENYTQDGSGDEEDSDSWGIRT